MPLPVLTAAAMRKADRVTIEEYGLPGFTLMETAGRASVVSILQEFGPLSGRRVVLLCGRGNNGGDGLVVARGLAAVGAKTSVVLVADPDMLTGETKANLELLDHIRRADATAEIEIAVVESNPHAQIAGADVVVDALLGTGLKNKLSQPIFGLVEAMNAAGCPVVSIDIPTGIDSDRGEVMGLAVRADLTVTMGALKMGLLFGSGPEHAGKVRVAEIGIPQHVLRSQADEPGCALVATDDDISSWLPSRTPSAHKYSVGMTLAVVGSSHYPGAAFLACKAAARSGSGYVVCATPQDVRDTFLCQLDDIPALGLPQTESGGLSRVAYGQISESLQKADALLIGCGLGKDPETMDLVRDLVSSSGKPGVLDADALHALRECPDLVANVPGAPWILTPHWGEFLSIAGDETLASPDRARLVGQYAGRWNCVLVLKGLPSVVGCPDGSVWIAGTGGPALATAGSGDVLAGLTAGLLSQGMAPCRAAVAALHIGGATAEKYRLKAADRSMMAGDMIDAIPGILRERFEKC